MELLIQKESEILREKLREAYSKPFAGKQRIFKVNTTVTVEES